MGDQFSFFNDFSPDEYIKSALGEVIKNNGLDGLTVEITKNKTSNAVKFMNSAVAWYSTGRKPWLMLPKKGKFDDGKKKPPYYKIDLDSIADLNQHMDKVCYILQYIIDHWPKDFSCCSRYNACSNAKTCIHPDKCTAIGCYYRRVLSTGQVFYGKNRTIKDSPT
jgi:hypothetical protein